MQNSEKNIHHQASNKPSFSKGDFGSKVNGSFQNKNRSKISRVKRCKVKPISHVKTVGLIGSKRKVHESSNAAMDNHPNGKPIRRKTLQEKLDANRSKKHLSSMLQGNRKLSIHSCEGAEKNNDRDVGSQKMERRRKRKKRRKNRELDDVSRIRRRTRYLLVEMKREQNLIDAYSGEGWNGQSREKIKPEKELQRAKKQILKCKLGIRDAIRQLESISSEGCLEDTVIDPDGSVSHEHIFCAKCKLGDAFRGNDIILCDGTCNCAFHQKCLEPPLATESIPPEDQGWFCRFCECKIEILEVINAHLGTNFSADSKWQDVFQEAATTSNHENTSLNQEDEWPSDDSADGDYDPDSRTGTEENMSAGASSSCSFLATSDEDDGFYSGRLGADGLKGYMVTDRNGDPNEINLIDSADSENSLDNADQLLERRRHRRDVDYKKLYDEMFGKGLPEAEQISDDEDWGPSRRKRKRNQSDAAGNVDSLRDMGTGSSNVVAVEDNKKLPSVSEHKRRTLFRIPPDAVKKFRKVFAENELPSRAVRESLSKQFGIAFQKVNKWFKNSRYTALKIRKEQMKQDKSSSGTAEQPDTSSGKSQTPDPVASEDNSYRSPSATSLQRSRSLIKAHRRRNPKSVTSPQKKKRRRKASESSPSDMDKVSVWLSQLAKLKKLKRKKAAAERKSVKEQQYLVEMERICGLQDRLNKLNEVLSRVCNNDPLSDEQPSVVYVPVAEVRDKV